MKIVEINNTPTTFLLPANDLRAALQCVSADSARPYLCGVLLAEETIVALDGHILLTISLEVGSHIGEEVHTKEGGFLLSCDASDKGFRVKSPHGSAVWVYGDMQTGILEFVTEPADDGEAVRLGVAQFDVLDAQFPDWPRVIAKGDGGTGFLAYRPDVLGKLIKAADVIDKGRAVRLTGGKLPSDPIRVDFKASERLRGSLMPVRWTPL